MRLLGTIALASLVVLSACKKEEKEITIVDREDSLTTEHDQNMAETGSRDEEQGPGHKPPGTDEEMISNAESAGPEAVTREATIVALDASGQLRTLRSGSGSFTCMPDNPTTPGNDPMCLDQNGLEWAQAWMGHTDPPAAKVGFGYMLEGGSDASNTDPYAKEPAPGQDWVDTGPHVMIFNATNMMQGYPDQAGDPTRPYVMWPGTPYAHLMVPVK